MVSVRGSERLDRERGVLRIQYMLSCVVCVSVAVQSTSSSFQHLHEESVNRCVTDQLEEEQVLQAFETDAA